MTGLNATSERLPDRTRAALDNVVMILTNKYMLNYKLFDPDKTAWKRLVDVARTRLSDIAQRPPEEARQVLSPVLAFTAGAIIRYDNTLAHLLQDLVDRLSDENTGQMLARSLETLVSPKECLSAENHAATKPLFKQWTYAQLVRPNWARSCPFNAKQPEAGNLCIAILTLLKHFPFEIYADDAEKLCRVLLTSMATLEPGQDLEAALNLLLQVLKNSPEELRGHMKTLIMGSVGIYSRANVTPMAIVPNYAASCRKLVLGLLAALPSKYEEQHLLPHTPVLKRMLANACGDRAREVRQAAIEARVAWANVV